MLERIYVSVIIHKKLILKTKKELIDYLDVKELNKAENIIIKAPNEENLECEGNRYNDINKNGIGWHGDAERKKVIGLRLGKSQKLCFNWFKNSKSVGKKFEITLNSGDLYIMTEKLAVPLEKTVNLYIKT